MSLPSIVSREEWTRARVALLEQEKRVTRELGGPVHELRGTSVFLRDGDRVFHTYSTYARGTEQVGGTHY